VKNHLVWALVLLSLVPLVASAQEAFDVEAATEAYLSQLTPEQKTSSDAYFEGGYWLILWVFLYGAVQMWLLLALGWSAHMRDFAERITSKTPLRTALYAVQFILLTAVLDFPLAWYTGFFREHQYGLANQTFGLWFGQQMIGLGLGLVIAPLLLMALYGVFRKAPQTWWLWGTAVILAFLLIGMLIAPVYIAPLFNTYTPVERPDVRDPVLAMARANGVPVDNIYVFDASVQSTRISANVSGILGTMRVSLNDNLLNRTSVPEIKAVMGHELGHYVLNHVYKGMTFLVLVILGAFGFLRFSYDWALQRWGSSWGVRDIGDPAGLPLLIVLISVYSFVLTPITNTATRTTEAEADIFGLNAAREPDGFATTALKLSEYRKLDPGPIEEFLFFDHPSGRTRIHMAMQWKAEHLDEFVERDDTAEDALPDEPSI
jgi:STE24 endopeptidase